MDDGFWLKQHKENIRLLNEKDAEIRQLVKNNNELKDRCEKLELQLHELQKHEKQGETAQSSSQ